MTDPSNPLSSHDSPTIAGDATLGLPTPLTPGVGGTPHVPRGLAGYQILQEIAHGGMGVVYLARHVALDRVVALKELIAGEGASPEMLLRFQREARAAARLQHPNIVPVYDVGLDGARLFFTMQYVEGRPLSSIAHEKPLSPRRALEIARKVALALHYAHQQGVLHRDVKPGNILLDAQGEPHLTDFGLAKEVDARQGVTVQGACLGTPNYAAPEQISGHVDLADARADVYSLGATLYEMLVGRAPFRGETAVQVVLQVLDREPDPPRSVNPSIHRDAETICLKAMQKDPARRYPSAGAMASDIERYLEGFPIEARPVTRTERLLRLARRNRLATLLSLALFVAACAGGAIAVRSAARQRAEARLHAEMVDRVLRELNRSGKALVDAALARRAMGDLKGSASYAADLSEPIDELLREAPRLAEPWYHRGRMLRALCKADEAERCQERAVALARAPGTTEGSRRVLLDALYERGVLRTVRLLQGISDRRLSMTRERAAGGGAVSVPTGPEVVSASPDLAALEKDAIADLRQVAEAKGANAASASCALGIAQMLEGDAHAMEPMAQALQIDPYREEAYTMCASIAEWMAQWQTAAEWFERGRQADRGYSPHSVGEARCLATLAGAAADPRPLYERALRVLDESLAVDPSPSTVWESKAWIVRARGEWGSERGIDPVADYQAALHAAERASALDPANSLPHCYSGTAHTCLGKWRHERGEDPTEEYRAAVAEFDKAIAIDPGEAITWSNRGSALDALAEAASMRGEAAEETYRESLAAYEKAFALNPTIAAAQNNIGTVWLGIGRCQRRQGKEATESYRRAVAAFEKARDLGLPGGGPEINLCGAWTEIADVQRLRGEDPSDAWRHGLDAAERGVAAAPGSFTAMLNRGMLLQHLGEWKSTRGEDPMQDYDRAASDMQKAVDLSPRSTRGLSGLAGVEQDIGQREAQLGRDPVPAFTKGIEACDRAIGIAPGDVASLHTRASLHWATAEWMTRAGRDPRAEIEKAVQDARAEIQAEPTNGDAWGIVAMAEKTLGDLAQQAGQDPSGPWDAAEKAYAKALETRPEDAMLLSNAALVHIGRALRASAQGKDARPEFEKALAEFEKARDANPQLVEAWANVGKTEEALAEMEAAAGADPSARYLRAVEDMKAALARNPTYVAVYQMLDHVIEGFGAWKTAHGQDPSAEYAEAVKAIEEGVAKTGGQADLQRLLDAARKRRK